MRVRASATGRRGRTALRAWLFLLPCIHSLPFSLHSSHKWRENDLYDGEVDDDDVYVEGERNERREGFIEREGGFY